MIELLPTIFERVEAGERVALAIVVATRGSSPQKAGAAMVVLEDGRTLGTLGGGCVEAETRARALGMLAGGEAGVVVHSYSLNSDLGWDDGLLCGGEMKIAVEVLREGSDLSGLKKLGQDLAARQGGTLVVEAHSPPRVELGRDAQATANAGRFTLRYLPAPRLVLAGAGHVARALAVQAGLAGFEVEVIDDRADFVTAARFPGARLHVGDVAAVLEKLVFDAATYVVIATRGHRNDAAALRAIVGGGAVGRAAAYKGLLGSKRKILTLMKELRAEGVSVEELKEIHAPIGLAIGAITPEEIAISVLAELIAVRRGVRSSAALGLPPEAIERHT